VTGSVKIEILSISTLTAGHNYLYKLIESIFQLFQFGIKNAQFSLQYILEKVIVQFTLVSVQNGRRQP
jgi:hypothetical protein